MMSDELRERRCALHSWLESAVWRRGAAKCALHMEFAQGTTHWQNLAKVQR